VTTEQHKPLTRYKLVVVVTKVLGHDMLRQLQQMLCLFSTAYNRRKGYDIVVFTTLRWTPRQVEALRSALTIRNTTSLTVESE
jgi:hypothetical protein